MNQQEKISLHNIDIITTLTESDKSSVYLVSIADSAVQKEENPPEFAVLKRYPDTNMMDFYGRIRMLHSDYLSVIYDVWEEDGQVCLLEEYVSGRTLQELLEQEEFLQEANVLRYMQELCEGVQVLHSANPPIIHRDIKPGNIIITPQGHVKLLDFDAAREYKESGERDTILLGTREYASPEQFGFSQTDVRSDIYSIGIVFAELLEHGQVSKTFEQRAHSMINHATMFDPEQRYRDVSTLIKDLRRLQSAPARPMWIGCMVGLLCMIVAGLWITGLLGQQAVENGLEVSEEVLAETLLSTEELQATEETVTSAEAENGYHYTSVVEEYRLKREQIENFPMNLYRGITLDNPPYEGMYSETQETAIGNQHPAIRFFHAAPKDIRISDVRMEGLQLNQVSYTPYLEEQGVHGEPVYLSDSDYCHEYGNSVKISKEYLETLEPGLYTLSVELSSTATGFGFYYYLVVHGEEDKIDSFRTRALNEIVYYSTESRNDVLIHISNTPYPIEYVFIGNRALRAEEYELLNEGFSVVLHSDLLEQYQDQQGVEIIFVTQDGRQVGARVINLGCFDGEG